VSTGIYTQINKTGRRLVSIKTAHARESQSTISTLSTISFRYNTYSSATIRMTYEDIFSGIYSGPSNGKKPRVQHRQNDNSANNVPITWQYQKYHTAA